MGTPEGTPRFQARILTLEAGSAHGISRAVRLYFVRHAQTEWNANGKAQGHSDVPLSEVGKRQARLLCERLAEWEPVPILSSDLRRARDTVAALEASGWSIETDARLRERNLGEWEGRSFEWIGEETDRRAAEQGVPRAAVRPAGGESQVDTIERARTVAGWLSGLNTPRLVASHRLFISQVIGCLLGGMAPRSFHFENTGLTELARHPEGFWQVLRHNDIKHLEVGNGALTAR